MERINTCVGLLKHVLYISVIANKESVGGDECLETSALRGPEHHKVGSLYLCMCVKSEGKESSEGEKRKESQKECLLSPYS